MLHQFIIRQVISRSKMVAKRLFQNKKRWKIREQEMQINTRSVCLS